MFNKPKFKYHFHIEVVEPDTVYLLSEKGHTALIGHFYTRLAPLLNGRYTVNEIFQKLQSEASDTSIFAVYHAIMRLESQGYLTEAEDNLPPQEAAFWSLQCIDSTEVINKLRNTKVAVRPFGAVGKNAFISALQSLNISVSEKGDFTVVLTDDYLQIGLDEFNRQAEATKKPWLLVKPVGAVIWVGPLFVPGKTGCWECLAKRLRGNREVETSVGQQKGMISTFPTSRAILPTSLQMGVNWAATETAKWIVTGEHQQLEGKVFTFDITSLSIEQHTLVKRPQCGVCGVSSPQQKPQPLILQSHKKQFTADGGHRCLSPQETLKKYEHHISPITGLVRALPKLESDSSLINVYAAAHQSDRKFDSLNSLRQGLGHNSAGKGKTDIQSKASGFCEAVERYSGIFTEDKYRIKGTYTQLKSEAIHPNSCMHYSTNQYQKRETWNSQHGHFAWVAEPFDEEKEIEWTPVWSLTTQTFKYLPTAFCYYGYPLDKGHRFCIGNSNGNAAGNTLEEAILQGFMELVERDCVALWWYNRVKRPALDLDSFNEPYLQALRDYYQTKNYELWVLDITNNLNIPSFAAIARRTDKPEEEIMLGYGTHFDPIMAINRAVTELNQMFAMLSQHDTMKNFDDLDQEYWFKNATLENQPYLAPDTNASLKISTDYQQYSCENDLKQDVLKCVEIAAQHSMETFVINQTCPDIGLSVVKVIVPEMRHFWPRFASGRLYDVPVKMGWLSAPLKEEELNPIPMFF